MTASIFYTTKFVIIIFFIIIKKVHVFVISVFTIFSFFIIRSLFGAKTSGFSGELVAVVTLMMDTRTETPEKTERNLPTFRKLLLFDVNSRRYQSRTRDHGGYAPAADQRGRNRDGRCRNMSKTLPHPREDRGAATKSYPGNSTLSRVKSSVAKKPPRGLTTTATENIIRSLCARTILRHESCPHVLNKSSS